MQLLTQCVIAGELCNCSELRELNLEYNKLTTPLLDMQKLSKLQSLQLYGNPLEYFPELSVCKDLRSLSLANLHVISDASFTRFEVQIGGSSNLAPSQKVNNLFAIIFRRSSCQHPLLAGALGESAPGHQHEQQQRNDLNATGCQHQLPVPMTLAYLLSLCKPTCCTVPDLKFKTVAECLLILCCWWGVPNWTSLSLQLARMLYCTSVLHRQAGLLSTVRTVRASAGSRAPYNS